MERHPLAVTPVKLPFLKMLTCGHMKNVTTVMGFIPAKTARKFSQQAGTLKVIELAPVP